MRIKTLGLATVLALAAAAPAFADHDDIRRDVAQIRHEKAEIAADKARERHALAHLNIAGAIAAERKEKHDERELAAERARLARDRR